MLSAFTARPIIEFKQRDKSKIESILAYGDRVLVGLQSGSLRIYRVNEPHDPPTPPPVTEAREHDEMPKTKPADLLREEEKFSRRPVQQLAYVKEVNILVSLSDGYVSIHDLETYALQEKLEKTRGATSFGVMSSIVKDDTTGILSIVSRLAVAVKRKILLWSWQDMELSGDIGEITLVAAVKSLTWASGAKIVAGMDPGFVMVDIETREITDINKPSSLGVEGAVTRFGAVSSSGMGYVGMGGWVPKPMATKLAEGQMLLAKDVNTLFIDTEGKPLDRRQVPWANAPEAVGYSYPFLLALPPPTRGALEVRNPDTLSLLQTISLPNATILHVPQPNFSLAHTGKGFFIASDRSIWRMGALDYESQIDELIAGSRYDEAVSLIAMLEGTLLTDKDGRLREVKMLKAQGLFDARAYRDSLDLYSDAQAPPQRVVALYPKSIAGEHSAFEPEKDEESPEPGEAGEKATSEPSKAAAGGGVSSIGRSMLGWKRDHKKTASDAASVKSLKTDSETASIKGKEADKALEGRDLVVAVNELRAFLAQTRVLLQKYINYDGKLKQPIQLADSQTEDYKPPFHHLIVDQSSKTPQEWEIKLHDVAKLVDTTLFRAYMLVSPRLAGSLFRLDNFCDPKVVNEKLYETGRYADLVDFLHGKKLHREALELLAKFGKNEADEEVEESLRGPQRTVGYLQQLPPDMVDIIVEFAEWPLQADADLGMEVFLADTENAETLPRHHILDFLRGIDKKLAVKYLEHAINELDDQTPEFHVQLVDFYLERLKGSEDPFESDEDRQQWLEKLHSFLKSSTQYNRAKAFKQLSADDPELYEARAIVLSQMGQHKQALQIYVFQIKDYQKAEEYCNQIHLSVSTSPASAITRQHHTTDAEDAPPSIYHTLLALYLSPPPPHSPNWPPALELLSKHGARLPASSTLDLIPATLPVRELEDYFRGRIRAANSALNEERIVSRLRGVEKVAVEAALLLGEDRQAGGRKSKVGGQGRYVVIGEDRHCAVCHKRFGGSAIRVYPDNSVVHYGCFPSGKGGGGAGGRRVSGW